MILKTQFSLMRYGCVPEPAGIAEYLDRSLVQGAKEVELPSQTALNLVFQAFSFLIPR